MRGRVSYKIFVCMALKFNKKNKRMISPHYCLCYSMTEFTGLIDQTFGAISLVPQKTNGFNRQLTAQKTKLSNLCKSSTKRFATFISLFNVTSQ